MQRSGIVAMEKAVAVELNLPKENNALHHLSSFARHLSSIVACPTFSEVNSVRHSDANAFDESVSLTDHQGAAHVPLGNRSGSRYHLDDNFKLAFLSNNSY